MCESEGKGLSLKKCYNTDQEKVLVLCVKVTLMW